MLHGADVRGLDVAAPARDATAEPGLYGHCAAEYGAGKGSESLKTPWKSCKNGWKRLENGGKTARFHGISWP